MRCGWVGWMRWIIWAICCNSRSYNQLQTRLVQRHLQPTLTTRVASANFIYRARIVLDSGPETGCLALLSSSGYLNYYTLVSARNKRIWTCCFACIWCCFNMLQSWTCSIECLFQRAVYVIPIATCCFSCFQHAGLTTYFFNVFQHFQHAGLNSMLYFQHAEHCCWHAVKNWPCSSYQFFLSTFK